MEEENKQIIIYKTADGKARFDVQLKDETVWLNQKQMAELFDKDRKTITEHIGNVFKEKELIEKTVCRKFQHTAPDGKNYDVNFYNLDVIISVGYRVKSLRGTQFRIWATNTLKQHLTQGYTLNKKRISQNYNNFLKAVDSVKKLLPKEGAMKSEDTLELMKMFASTSNKEKVWKLDEMDADHVAAWSKGGATDIKNCQMLCKTHNRAKGNR